MNDKGMTATEVVVMTAILGILAVPMAKFLHGSLKSVTRSNLQISSQDKLRIGLDHIERDFMEMNEVTVSSATFIEFRMDSYRLPTYVETGDMDGDGLTNEIDADDDNDVTSIVSATAAWTVGYDHKDDDDGNNGQIDVQCRYYLAGKDLVRDFNYNGAGWGANTKIIATNISSFTITYYGSKSEDLGQFIDLGNDGNGATGDTGENDGIISPREIDWVQPATGHGNRSGRIDTANERRYIVSLHLYIAQDLNGDGTNDFKLETQLLPPLLTVKRRF